MKKLLLWGALGAALCVSVDGNLADAGVFWGQPKQQPAGPAYYRHEYARYDPYCAPGGVDFVPGSGPAYYPNGPVYYYAGGFMPGGFNPNYENWGGNGGFRLDYSGRFRPAWGFPGVIP